MMTALQRMEPGDPRAKAIEAMARGVRQRWLDEQRLDLEPAWEHLHDESKDSYLADARAALAALEEEGLVLTDTRAVERLELGDDAVHIRDPGDRLRTLCGHHVPNARRIGDPVLDAAGECWTCQAKAEALSSVPVEEEESDAEPAETDR